MDPRLQCQDPPPSRGHLKSGALTPRLSLVPSPPWGERWCLRVLALPAGVLRPPVHPQGSHQRVCDDFRLACFCVLVDGSHLETGCQQWFGGQVRKAVQARTNATNSRNIPMCLRKITAPMTGSCSRTPVRDEKPPRQVGEGCSRHEGVALDAFLDQNDAIDGANNADAEKCAGPA